MKTDGENVKWKSMNLLKKPIKENRKKSTALIGFVISACEYCVNLMKEKQ